MLSLHHQVLPHHLAITLTHSAHVLCHPQYWRPAMVVDIEEELQQLEAFSMGGGDKGVTIGVHEPQIVGGNGAGGGSGGGGGKGSGSAPKRPAPTTEAPPKTGHY